MKINIIKCHGSGNDFIMIDEYNNQYDFSEIQRVALTKKLCSRKESIGADGMLFYKKSNLADCRMRMFNPDGSEAEMCGNGIRCIARYCTEKSNKTSLKIETMKKVLTVQQTDDIFEGIKTLKTEISPISFDPNSLPMVCDSENFINMRIDEISPSLSFTALSVPNPHIISIVENIDQDMLVEVGTKANAIQRFPKGVNVSFCKISDKQKMFVATFERGVGLTYSCGTGMTASAVVSCLSGNTDYNKDLFVYNKGGMVKCNIGLANSQYNASLAGNATYVFLSTIDFDFDKNEITKEFKREMFDKEIKAYEKFVDFVGKI